MGDQELELASQTWVQMAQLNGIAWESPEPETSQRQQLHPVKVKFCDILTRMFFKEWLVRSVFSEDGG